MSVIQLHKQIEMAVSKSGDIVRDHNRWQIMMNGVNSELSPTDRHNAEWTIALDVQCVSLYKWLIYISNTTSHSNSVSSSFTGKI